MNKVELYKNELLSIFNKKPDWADAVVIWVYPTSPIEIPSSVDIVALLAKLGENSKFYFSLNWKPVTTEFTSRQKLIVKHILRQAIKNLVEQVSFDGNSFILITPDEIYVVTNLRSSRSGYLTITSAIPISSFIS